MPIPERLNPSFASSLPSAQVQNDPMEEARRRLIVALDVPSPKAALELVNQLESTCQWFKVGMELFVAAGPAVLEPLVARGHSVFLDLKIHRYSQHCGRSGALGCGAWRQDVDGSRGRRACDAGSSARRSGRLD